MGEHRRQRGTAERYERLETEYADRIEELYSRQTSELDRRIQRLIAGEDAEFLERVQDLEETRDRDLVRLKIMYDYLMDENGSIYNEEMDKIDHEHTSATRATHDRVVHRLESSLRRFKDDKSLLDISGDGQLEIGNLSLPSAKGSGSLNGNGGAMNGGSASGFASGGATKKRRRAAVANYDTTGGGGASSDSQLSEYPQTAELSSVATFLGDMDDVGSTGNSLTMTGGRNKSALKFLSSLKNDEMNQDIDMIRRAKR
ncbi:hypothetical protein TRICI_000543 [Trichomonascus ciferrii]|uniref:Transcriptional regulatory protein SDS3 n=1 Tax=Trichomonascus ciferrii TaxID=44093 RepID=A0A642VD45_9ASCO|nr:hypothetical protein TRICI_000543 [Trichomonascus ciferrii]